MTPDQPSPGYADCPACGYKNAFSMTVKDGKKLYYCHAGCSQADLLAVIRGPSPLPVSPRTETQVGKQDYIQRLWCNESRAAAGTLAACYLASRGFLGPIPPALRFLPDHPHRPTGTRWPVMLAAVTDIDGRLQAVHRTYLAHDGKAKAPIEPAKMTLGLVGGFACHLSPADKILAISEGIETGLAVQLSTGLPTWAAISAGGMRQLILPLLPYAQDVIICADNDENGCGQKAANDAAQRWLYEGRHVRIALPPTVGIDFNDLAIRENHHAFK